MLYFQQKTVRHGDFRMSFLSQFHKRLLINEITGSTITISNAFEAMTSNRLCRGTLRYPKTGNR